MNWMLILTIISVAAALVSCYIALDTLNHIKKIDKENLRLSKEQEKLNKKYNDAFDTAKVRITHKNTGGTLYSYIIVSNIGGAIARNVHFEFISEKAPRIDYNDNLEIIPMLYDGGDSFQYSICNNQDVPLAVIRVFWEDDKGEESLDFDIQLYKPEET